VATIAPAAGSGDTVALSTLNPGEAVLIDTDGVHAWSVLVRGRANSDNETVNGNLAVGGALGVTGKATFAQRPTFASNMPWDSGNLADPATLSGAQTFSGQKGFSVRPTFAGNTPWDSGNLNFASPPAIGGTAPASAIFTTVQSRVGSVIVGNGGNNAGAETGSSAAGSSVSSVYVDHIAIATSANLSNLYLSKPNSYQNPSLASFFVTGNSVGSISTNGASVAYNTVSDYRLKDGLTPMSGALKSVRSAKLYTGYFKSDASRTRQDMILAHEIAEIVPDAVTGEKDAVEYVPAYREGYDLENVQPEDVLEVLEHIVPQHVDHSRLVLRLWGALQELANDFDEMIVRVARLETRQ
jgi:hypothetical protein